MIANKNVPRLAGVAFLIVLVASALSALLLNAATGSGSITEILIHISNHLTLMRASVLVELVTSIGIIVLAVLLYAVFHKQNKVIALVALGFWLAEAINLAVSKIGGFALLSLSQEFVKAGAPNSSSYQALGEFMYQGVDRTGYAIHFLFYLLGGLLWFYLFYRTRFIPRILAVWGLVAESVALIGAIFQWCGVEVNIVVYSHIAVLEFVIGLWLVVRGIRLHVEPSP